ncbi:unnamed protein product [Citrullus colocynthis]|uniref:Uncharacterized protein n=1 Tax=Citrullus colocynthis TaxID=252529 RepID=A0ABP0YZZ4_9ROSI
MLSNVPANHLTGPLWPSSTDGTNPLPPSAISSRRCPQIHSKPASHHRQTQNPKSMTLQEPPMVISIRNLLLFPKTNAPIGGSSVEESGIAILTVASEEQVKRQPSFWLTVKELTSCSWGRKESTHLGSEIRQTLTVLS